VISIKTGKTLKIFSGLLNDISDEICCIKAINEGSEFIIGDQAGSMYLVDSHSGEQKAMVYQKHAQLL